MFDPVVKAKTIVILGKHKVQKGVKCIASIVSVGWEESRGRIFPVVKCLPRVAKHSFCWKREREGGGGWHNYTSI